MNGGLDRAPAMMSEDRHRPIIDAIESGDVSSAVRVLEEHMAVAADHLAVAGD